MPIASYLNQTATRSAKTSRDKFGAVIESAPVSFECRLQNIQKRLVDDQGKEYETDAEMWIKPDQTLAIDDKITIDATNYRVVRIDTKRNLSGKIDHKKVYLLLTKG